MQHEHLQFWDAADSVCSGDAGDAGGGGNGLAGFCSRRHSGGDALVVGRHRLRVHSHVLLLTSLAYGHGSGVVFEKTVFAASP